MKLVKGNIYNRVQIIQQLATPSISIDSDSVRKIYHKNLQNKNLPSNWGKKRRSTFYAREYFYTAVNLLKAKYILNGKSATNIPEGYVYFLIHPQLGNYTKIGSCIDIGDRLSSFNVGCPLKQYSMVYYFFSSDRRKDEKELHKQLANKNISGEWFDIFNTRREWEIFINSLTLNKVG